MKQKITLHKDGSITGDNGAERCGKGTVCEISDVYALILDERYYHMRCCEHAVGKRESEVAHYGVINTPFGDVAYIDIVDSRGEYREYMYLEVVEEPTNWTPIIWLVPFCYDPLDYVTVFGPERNKVEKFFW